MKTIKTIILGIMLSFSTILCASPIDKLTYDIDTLMVNLPANIHIYKTNEFGIGIKAPNKYIYDNIKWNIKDSILTIDFNNIDMIKQQLIESDDIKINIGLPNEVKCIKTNSSLVEIKKIS